MDSLFEGISAVGTCEYEGLTVDAPMFFLHLLFGLESLPFTLTVLVFKAYCHWLPAVFISTFWHVARLAVAVFSIVLSVNTSLIKILLL